jgi:hypothetical protein
MLINPDRAQQVSLIKIQINITLSKLNEISRFKVQYNQHGKIYDKHINISPLARFEFQPDLKSRNGFVVVWPCSVETTLL